MEVWGGAVFKLTIVAMFIEWMFELGNWVVMFVGMCGGLGSVERGL